MFVFTRSRSEQTGYQPTTYTYDSAGRLDKVTNARGNVTDYDLNDREEQGTDYSL